MNKDQSNKCGTQTSQTPALSSSLDISPTIAGDLPLRIGEIFSMAEEPAKYVSDSQSQLKLLAKGG